MHPLLTRLRRIAECFCSPRALEQVVDPVIADIHVEHRQALRQHGKWWAYWALLNGAAALAKAFAIHECHSVGKTIFDRTAPDDDGLRKMFRSTTFAVLALTVIRQTPALYRYIADLDGPLMPFAVLMLLPSALALTVPMGVMSGIFYGLREGRVTPRAVAAVMLATLLCSIVMFATLDQILPAANQAFRAAVFGPVPHPPKGLNEMTLRELREALDLAAEEGGAVKPYAYAIHHRVAFAASTFFLALFALAVSRRRRSSCRRAGCTALATGGLFYVFVGFSNSTKLELAPIVVAWFPNLAFLFLALVCLRSGNANKPIGSQST